jgi:ATP-dependent helicase/nuclease subunit A
VPQADLPAALARAQAALSQVMSSPRGRWIFEQGGTEARNEYAISGILRGRLVRAVVDRTFVDDQGVRWVVDYKTGFHEGGDVEAFLDAEMERYRPQLERYANLLRRSDDRPIRMGLFFPLLGGWREWE